MSAPTVLMINSDADWCERICRLLEPLGIQVTAAADEAAAVEALEHGVVPSVVLVDVADYAHRDRQSAQRLRCTLALEDAVVVQVRKNAPLDNLLLLLMNTTSPAVGGPAAGAPAAVAQNPPGSLLSVALLPGTIPAVSMS